MNLKINISIIILLVFSGVTALSQEVFKNSDLTITKLEKNMWVVETTDNTTMYIIEGNDKALLIDTGTKCEKLDEVVKQITSKPVYVVVTHMHRDHSGNIAQFDEVYLHAADTVLLNRIEPYKGQIHFVKGGDVFDLGGTMLEVMHMPGHTPGSIILLDRASGNAYTGDAFGSGQVWMQLLPHVSMEIYAESCNRMEALMDKEIKRIYCGHYPYVKSAFDKTYITNMHQLARKLSAGVAPEGKPYSVKVSIGTQNPMIITQGDASIVYDPENIN